MDDLRIVGLVFPSEKRNRGRRRFAPHARGERMKIVRSIVAAAAASLVFMSASGLARSAEMTPALQTVIKAAQAEGSLKIVWLQSALGGGRGAKAIQDGMNKVRDEHRYQIRARRIVSPGRQSDRSGTEGRPRGDVGRLPHLAEQRGAPGQARHIPARSVDQDFAGPNHARHGRG
jgi:hypothetical protein